LPEGGRERAWVDALKDSLEGVVTGNPIGELEETLEPLAALSAERGDLLPVIGASNNGADGDADDVEQVVERSAARVLEVAEVGLDCQAGHDSPP
jgi:hypothetical protein